MKKMIYLSTLFVGVFFLITSAWAYQPFPDTGQTKCYDNYEEITCPQPGQPFYGQDGHYQPRLPRSYSKLGYGGTVLADSALHVDNGGPWIMTRDNVTGLIWEVKREDGLQSKNNTYSWYDPNPETNGGDAGTQDGGSCTGTQCDTYSYIQALNAQSFGGFSDWRLPSVKELSSLANRGVFSPPIDTAWFPKTVLSAYWSSTTYGSYASAALYVCFSFVGSVHGLSKSYSYYVRAVRAGNDSVFTNFIDNGDDTVTDTETGQMWQKETAPGSYTWQQALEYAENLTLAGYSDWRLPNINELQTLVDYSSYNPAIYPVFRIHTVLGNYWSSTTYANSPHTAWRVNFSSGHAGGFKKSHNYYYVRDYVRVVRSGHSDIGQFGSLVFYMEPQGAVNAGAQWRRKGTSIWYDSGFTETKVPVGTYTIEFKVVPGWRPEETITVTVEADKKAIGTGSYFEQTTALPGVMMLLLDE